MGQSFMRPTGDVIPFPVVPRPVPKIPWDDSMAVVRAGYDMREAMARFAEAAIACGETEFAVGKIEAEAQEIVNFLIKVSHGK